MSEKFLILRRIKSDTSTNVHRLSCKLPIFLSDLVEIEFFQQTSKKYWNIKFHENPSSGKRVDLCGRTDRHTDTTNLIVTLRNSMKPPIILFLNFRFGISCMSPKANLTLWWVSVSVVVGAGAVLAVFGAILLLISICLIIGAQKVSDAFTLLSTLWIFPTN